MKKRYIVLSICAGLAGGILSSALRPVGAFAETRPIEELKAQRFTLVNQNGEPMGSFSFDNSGRPQIILRDDRGHDVWRLVAEHPVDRPGDYHVNSGHFQTK